MRLSYILRTLTLFCVSSIHGTSSQPATKKDLTTTITSTKAAIAFTTVRPSCAGKCGFRFPDNNYLTWQAISITANFTHATVVEVINTVRNTTRYSTIFNEVPANITVPPTNKAGTRVATTTIVKWPGSTVTTEIAYPTGYYDYSFAYAWSGTLEFTKANSTYCSTATKATTISMKSHPIIPYSSPYMWPQDWLIWQSCTTSLSLRDAKATSTVPKEVACPTHGHIFPHGGDATGLNYEMVAERYGGSFDNEDLFPEFAEYANCSNSAEAPAGFLTSVGFLTVKSVSHEGDSSTSFVSKSTSTLQTTTVPVYDSLTHDSKSTSEADFPTSTVLRPQASTGLRPTSPDTKSPTKEGPRSPSLTTVHQAVSIIGSRTVTPIANAHTTIDFQTLKLNTPITSGQGFSTTVIVLSTNEFREGLLVVGTSTSTISIASPSNSIPQAITIGSESIAYDSKSRFIVSGQTLTQGGKITIGLGAATTIIALTTDTANRNLLVVGSNTSTLARETSSLGQHPLVVGSITTSINDEGEYFAEGNTVKPMGSITLESGPTATILAPLITGDRLDDDGEDGSPHSTASFSGDVGSLIINGLGGGNPESGSAGRSTARNTRLSVSTTSNGSRKSIKLLTLNVSSILLVLLYGW
ncbi:hypothetical protein EJ08DRAFT_662813 [Tothia fuscella]|uniref:Uncharacterized protein n=1 Tax=Tothia fuscella TaxID=1048955 RepID=A0A9P4TWE6_9PEZI|nr:hypothetical protein EJ08DRAFT_662813 [Tothia fuscella]